VYRYWKRLDIDLGGQRVGGYFEKAFWDYYARSYDNLAAHFRPYQDLVTEVCDHVDRIGGGRSLRVLDAGCGTGNYTWELTRRGHEVVGVDSSPAMLARAEAKLVERRPPTFTAHDLASRLPFPDQTFDAAVCVHVFYTLPDPHSLAQELRRVVRDNGTLVAVTLQSPVTVVGSLVESYHAGGIRLFARTFRVLFGVGACNLVIAAKQRGGAYRNMDAEVFRSFLISNGMTPTCLNTTYTCGISVLAVAGKDS